jgi:hypothetical protein
MISIPHQEPQVLPLQLWPRPLQLPLPLSSPLLVHLLQLELQTLLLPRRMSQLRLSMRKMEDHVSCGLQTLAPLAVSWPLYHRLSHRKQGFDLIGLENVLLPHSLASRQLEYH